MPPRTAHVFVKRWLPIALWASGIGVGFMILARFQAQGGAVSIAAAEMPLSRAELLDPDRVSLIVFAHPHCPCTRATVGELDRIAAKCVGRVRITVIFTSAPELGEEWAHTALWERAQRIPGTDVRADPLGVAARELGARTSGEALVYSPAGHLLFHGGITAARGHAGDNVGATAVVELAHGRAPAAALTPVFGCRLVGAEDACTCSVDACTRASTGEEAAP